MSCPALLCSALSAAADAEQENPDREISTCQWGGGVGWEGWRGRCLFSDPRAWVRRQGAKGRVARVQDVTEQCVHVGRVL